MGPSTAIYCGGSKSLAIGHRGGLVGRIYRNASAGNVESVNRLWKAQEPGNEVIESESVLSAGCRVKGADKIW
jgi:hypothetical protein